MLPLVSVTVPNVSVKFAKLAIPPVTVRFPLDSASLIPHANVPALIVVKPVKVFAAESVTVPPVFVFSAIAPPAKTALIVPLSTVYDAEEAIVARSEEHTSELQSHHDLVCRLLLEKKKKIKKKKTRKRNKNEKYTKSMKKI